MIYNLNGDTHWELSPALMRELVSIVDNHTATVRHDTRMLAELCNFRSAIQNELDRTRDNMDLIA